MSDIEKRENLYKEEHEEIIVDFLSKFNDPFEYRRTGRSTVLAKAYIRIAMRYPNEWIHPRDHFFTRDMDLFLLGTIAHIINLDYPEYKDLLEVNFNGLTFRFVSLKNKKENNWIETAKGLIKFKEKYKI